MHLPTKVTPRAVALQIALIVCLREPAPTRVVRAIFTVAFKRKLARLQSRFVKLEPLPTDFRNSQITRFLPRAIFRDVP